MKESGDEKLQQLLKKTFAPADAELERDLWPRMLARLQERPVEVPWWDWALAALAAACLFFFQDLIPALLYHL